MSYLNSGQKKDCRKMNLQKKFMLQDKQYLVGKKMCIRDRYVGWGGIPEAFDENNSSWADEFIELIPPFLPMSMKAQGQAP